MIDLNKEMNLTDTERVELSQHLFDVMLDLNAKKKLVAMDTTDVYNLFVDKPDLPEWIRRRVINDFEFASKLHELVVRYKDQVVMFPMDETKVKINKKKGR